MSISKKIVLSLLSVSALSLTATPARAWFIYTPPPPPYCPPTTPSVPEINTSGAIPMAALVLGSVAVMAAGRKEKKA